MSLNPQSNLRCPSCDMLVEAEQSKKSLPFCSERCRLIDLGRWLNEEHLLAVEVDEEDAAANLGEPESSQPAIKLPPGWHDA
ncbi:MAG: DNA gyrase inhibitor YacG [Pirellulaceae bacterium]